MVENQSNCINPLFCTVNLSKLIVFGLADLREKFELVEVASGIIVDCILFTKGLSDV
jgi:hypothetical protein